MIRIFDWRSEADSTRSELPFRKNCCQRIFYIEVTKMNEAEHAVITVMGQDRVGIVAGVSKILAENGVNIVDISQTILQGIFAMILLVDISKAQQDLIALQETLQTAGASLGVRIVVQHEDIFRYMHRI